MTFRSYQAQLEGEVSQEDAQLRYNEYQLNYVTKEVATAFYTNHKREEWFMERYNPLKRRERELATQAWSHRESELFSTEARSRPLEFLRACCLEPYGADIRKRAEGAAGPEPGSDAMQQEAAEGEPMSRSVVLHS